MQGMIRKNREMEIITLERQRGPKEIVQALTKSPDFCCLPPSSHSEKKKLFRSEGIVASYSEILKKSEVSK